VLVLCLILEPWWVFIGAKLSWTFAYCDLACDAQDVNGDKMAAQRETGGQLINNTNKEHCGLFLLLHSFSITTQLNPFSKNDKKLCWSL
jgi:hypothetical protein